MLVRLNDKLTSKYISRAQSSGMDNITQLLLSSKVVKEWLGNPLHHDFVSEHKNIVIFLKPNLKECDKARVAILFICEW